MNKIFKYAMLAIFLINNGMASANQVESNESTMAEHSVSARSGTGIACYPGDCCEAYRQYVGDVLYPVQGTAPGTVCKAGNIVHAYECSTPCSTEQAPKPAATAAPTAKATSAPPVQATEKPKPATAAPTVKATEAPKPATAAPTAKATAAPTAKATAAPTAKATEAPATAAPTVKATQRPPTQATQKPVPATAAPTSKPATAAPSTGLCDVVPTSQEPLKFLVPLYVYPTSGKWDIVAEGAKKVPTIAIVNPNNGPTNPPSSSYVAGMDKLKAANAEMVGYVYTSYGSRPIADAKKDIDTYKSKYPHVTGIFFDEASAKASDLPFYRELYNYVIAKGYKHSILNPGTQPDAGYVAISSNIVVFETYGDRWAQKSFGDFVKCAPNAAAKAGYKYKFSGIAHSVSGNTASTKLIKEMEQAGVGMVYITDGTPANSVYDPLPSYFAAQVSEIQKINQQ